MKKTKFDLAAFRKLPKAQQDAQAKESLRVLIEPIVDRRLLETKK